MAHESHGFFEEHFDGSHEILGGEITITPGRYQDERIFSDALEEWATDWTNRLVPDFAIVARPLGLHGAFLGLVWGYAVLLRRLMSALRDIQEAIRIGQMTDEQALIDAHIKVHATVLEMRGARYLLARSNCHANGPALSQFGHCCVTVTKMCDELRTLCEEYGVPVHELDEIVTVLVEW